MIPPRPILDLRQVLWAALLLVLFLLLSGCRSARPAVALTSADSLHTEVHTAVSYRTDTVRLSLPLQSASAVLSDADSSTLETDFAECTVTIAPDGTLRHTLRTKEVSLPVAVSVPVLTRDSVTYRDRTVTATPTAAPSSKTESRRRRGKVLLLCLSVALVAGAATLYLSRRRS